MVVLQLRWIYSTLERFLEYFIENNYYNKKKNIKSIRKYVV